MERWQEIMNWIEREALEHALTVLCFDKAQNAGELAWARQHVWLWFRGIFDDLVEAK